MMISRKFSLVGLTVLVGLVSPSIALAADEPIDWLTDSRAAMATAAESGRPLLIDVWAVWCEPCKLMEQTTYRDPRILRAMANFVPLKVDADADEIFVERYEIDGYPTTMFLDPEGREIHRMVSLIETDALLQAMTRVHAGYADYAAQIDHSGDADAMRGAARYLMGVENPRGAADLLRGALKATRAAGDDGQDAIELELARALLASDRTGPALKILRRLSTEAGQEATRGQALAALARAEREHGKPARADQALARLRTEFPELATQLE